MTQTKRFGIDYENTIESNRELWTKHEWQRGGDEWDGQAIHLGMPYAQWKQSLIDHLIVPHVQADMVALEIAAGHGRWSEALQPLCKTLILVDLNQECIDKCRQRFAAKTNVQYVVTDGQSLPGVADGSVDFVWSFDSFVHMSPDVIDAYLREIRRVLSPRGQAIIHHAGRDDGWLWLGAIRAKAAWLRKLYTRISMGTWNDHDGWRANVSAELVARLARAQGLRVERQLQFWDAQQRVGVPRFGDRITVLRPATGATG